MIIRPYAAEDKDQAKAIFAQYWTDNEFLNELEENMNGDLTHFYVAENNGVIIGVAGFRKAPEHLKSYAETENPAELYIVASKSKNEGTGSALVEKVIEETKSLHFTELECYSPETHDSSWKFYQKLGFIKHGIINDPDDGYPGMLWRKIIE